jgi:NTE family protein
MKREYGRGLVLSGGAARGIAHLGILKAMEEAGMMPDIISGVSAGAIAGVLYADGFAPEEILEIYTRKSIFEFMKMTVPKTGLFKPSGLRETLNRNLRSTRFEQLRIPLIVTATNLLDGRPDYFSTGELLDPILASASIPVLLETVIIGKIPYIDGGVMNNMPVEPLLNRCDMLIGAYINPTGTITSLKGMMHIAERAFHLAIDSEIHKKKSYFDLFIEPQEIVDYTLFDLSKAPDLFRLGYEKARGLLYDAANPGQTR